MATTTVISTEKYGAIHWLCFARGCCCTMLSTTVHSSPAGVEWSILVGISLDPPIITAILAILQLSWYTSILLRCYPAILLSCKPATCHQAILLSGCPAILSSCYPDILQSYHPAILLFCYPTIVRFCSPAILLLWNSDILYPAILLSTYPTALPLPGSGVLKDYKVYVDC